MIKVLGIGSPFGDDQVGWQVANLLSKKTCLQNYIPQFLRIENHDRPGIRLLELMNDAQIVFIIDAVVSGNEIGTYYRLQNLEIIELKSILSTHHIGITQALQLGQALNQLPSNIIFYGVEIDAGNRSEFMSDPVKFAIKRMLDDLEKEIIEWLTKIKF